MSSKDNCSTQDLRSAAAERHRDVDQKHKWAYGQAYGPHDTAHARPRPRRPYTSEPAGMRRDGVATATFKARSREGRQANIHDYNESGDSSAPEEIEELSSAPEPDAQITYSYDAARGPSHGSQILSAALAKAVERYEVVATDKLIQDEYEVLDSEGEPVIKSKGRGKSKALPASSETVVDEDGFELL